jgi:geranylgeranyl pyrophosphate synthase
MKVPSEAAATTIDETDVRRFFIECRTLVDAQLDRLMPSGSLEPVRIHQAMRWSVFAGGKRFRPALLLASGAAFGAGQELLINAACALEMIHTYSLIHDDLPAMDDDALRRGRPTCHIRFDEATAILAGDALQTLAFQTISEDVQLTMEVRVRLIQEIARAAGTPNGMIAGQVDDLAAESRAVSGSELEGIHRRKTGALITASARCGALIAGVFDDELDAITRYSAALGLLFQITDDLLDVTASAEELGKTPGKDARARKATYPALYGLDGARRRAIDVYDKACAALDEIKTKSELLRALAHYILQRKG